MDQLKSEQGVLFDSRFLDRYAGPIITDTGVAIVELVANAWDAFATKVEITWPNRATGSLFSIRDNGKGMTADQFQQRWGTLDYDKLSMEGNKTAPPPELNHFAPRDPYGRNGRGRHAAFRFSDPYVIATWRDGLETSCEVKRGLKQPFELRRVASQQRDHSTHGTEIRATSVSNLAMAAETAREVLGTRFLADPNFEVFIDGTRVTFDDIPRHSMDRVKVEVPGHGTAEIVVIDSLKSDKTTKQHGIAWRVKSRLVGSPSWVGFDHERILDGRSSEAKRFLFIVFADFLDDAVTPDWTGFNADSVAWKETRPRVHDAIKATLSEFTADKRREAKATVRETHFKSVAKLPPAGRERWNQFVDRVVDACPSITVDQVGQVAGILATLEAATSKYGVISKLHDFAADDFDTLDSILQDWTIRLAKDALDEIQSRLKLIAELDVKLRDPSMSEVGDLQPLIDKSLWVFGPEYESIEFTSNKGMTEVVRKFFGASSPISRLRPDYVIVPDGSVGLYSRDSYDSSGEVIGTDRLVIAEIKRAGVGIGSDQITQPWNYAKILKNGGHISDATSVTCFVLGSAIEAGENEPTTRGNVVIVPMTYNVFIRRAQARMLGLRAKLADVPFLQEYVEGLANKQGDLELVGVAASA
ncbi:ATP-binding protein [Mesorhizobium sp. M0136]|uniref:ATP-binding protein n=1 Tax=Mesorhizobium sp. M0136 TaxID=2956890 RepID=UPI00333A3EDF